MKKTVFAVLVSTGLMAPGFALAENLPWDQVGIGYESLKIDDVDLTMKGVSVNASKEFAGNFFISGKYSSLSDNVAGLADIDYDEFRLGLGYFKEMTSDALAFVTVQYIDQEASALGISDSTDGVAVGAGLRFTMTERAELGLSVDRFKIDDIYDTKITAELRVKLANQFAAVANVSQYTDAFSYYVGVNYYF